MPKVYRGLSTLGNYFLRQAFLLCSNNLFLIEPPAPMDFTRRLLALLFIVSVCFTAVLADSNSTGLQGFIPNAGQWPSDVLFMAQQQNATVWITRTGVVVDEYTVDQDAQIRSGRIIRENFSTTMPATSVKIEEGTATVSFIKGDDSRHWRTVRVANQVVIEPIKGLVHVYSLASDGRIQRQVHAASDELAQALTMRVTGLATQHQIAEVSPVTSTVYGSYVGGPGAAVFSGVEYLSNGDVVVCGTTSEISFPNAIGGYSATMKGTSDGFVCRFDTKLQRVRSYTFIGGSGDDRVRAICRDAQNAVYVAGETTSSDFPTTSGVTGKLYKASTDGIVAKLDSTLTKLSIGLYHGGNKDDVPRAIAVGNGGVIVVAGYTNSTANFPVTFPATITVNIPGGRGRPPTTRQEPGGGVNMGQIDGFVASFSATGAMQQSRFFGRENNDYFTAMTLDNSNSVYLTGWTTSANFETAPTADRFSSGRLPFDNSFNGGTTDAFVVKLNNELALAKSDDGTYSSFFGGNKEEEGRAIGIDDLGRAYVVGVTNSTDLKAIGTLNTQAIGKQDIFLAVVSDDGRELVGSTYYGGTGNDEPFAMKMVAGTSSVVMVGTTSSEDFPFAGEGLVAERSGPTDGFLAVINLATNQYATLVTGNREDTVKSLAIGPYGSPYYVASTTSTNLHVKDSSYLRASDGTLGGYVAKHSYGVLELTAPTGGETYCVGISKPISWSALGMPDTTKFRIEYARAGSNVWQDVVKSVGGRSYSWKVPALPTGDYVLRVSTIYNHVSQLLTPFTISNPPSIEISQPFASACPGKPATMCVSASGAGLRYQWRKSGVNIPNATQECYTIPALDVTGTGKYDCLVSGTCSPSATTPTITVSLDPATEIMQQPKANTAVNVGASFTLSVTASGSDLLYQWFKDAAPVANATSAQLSVAAATKADAGDYYCQVRGTCGTVNSQAGSVVVEGGTSVIDELQEQLLTASLVGPQPTTDEVRLRVNGMSTGHVNVRIVDVHGHIVQTYPLGVMMGGEHTVSVSMSSCANGSYAVQLISAGQIATVRVQVAR